MNIINRIFKKYPEEEEHEDIKELKPVSRN